MVVSLSSRLESNKEEEEGRVVVLSQINYFWSLEQMSKCHLAMMRGSEPAHPSTSVCACALSQTFSPSRSHSLCHTPEQMSKCHLAMMRGSEILDYSQLREEGIQ